MRITHLPQNPCLPDYSHHARSCLSIQKKLKFPLMNSHPEHILELRRRFPDIYTHFTAIVIPTIYVLLTQLVPLAQEKSESSLTPILLDQNQPWPKLLTYRKDFRLIHSDYTLMSALETLLLSSEVNPHAQHLHICNHHPTLAARRTSPQHEVSFQLAPKIKSY